MRAAQDRQRARSGRSRTVAPPSSRITRSRPCPHRASLPVLHDGQASRPPARSAEAAAASAHNSTASLPDHDGDDARPGHRAPEGAGVAACPARRRPATQTGPDVSKRHSELRRESRHRLSQHELPDAHGVVAHENGHQPPDPDRHAHARRRQTSSSAQEERRGTPGRGAEISQPCGISAALNASVLVWLAWRASAPSQAQATAGELSRGR